MKTDVETNARNVRDHYNRLFALFGRENSIPEQGFQLRPPIMNIGYWARGAGNSREAQIAFVHELAERLPNLKDRRVLDVGCGLAGPAIILAGDYGAQVDALNINEQQVAWARQFSAGNGLEDRVRVHLGNAMSIPFPEGAFDAVFCLEAAHCFADKPQFLAEVRRVLHPGGRLVLADLTSTTRLPLLRWLPALKLNLITAADWRHLVEASGLVLTQWELVGKDVYPAFRRHIKKTAPDRRRIILDRICPPGALLPERLWKGTYAWTMELAYCRSYFPLMSALGFREYVLLVADKRA